MTNPTYITPGPRRYDIAGALSKKLNVKTASGTVSAKAGHLLVHINGAWYAYAKTTDALAQTITVSQVDYKPDAVGVLLEDADLSTTAVACQVLYAGKAWIDFVRDSGIEATTTSDDALITAPGKIVFADAEEV